MKKDIDSLYRACTDGDRSALVELEPKLRDLLNLPVKGENSPLIMAADSGFDGIVRTLLEYGADVNYRTDLGETALDVACFSGYVESVKILLEFGANPTSVDRFGISVVDRAKESGSNEVVSLILKHISNWSPRRAQ